MDSARPGVFVIGSSTTLLMHPWLERMLEGTFSYSRKGHEKGELEKALSDLDKPQGASAGDSRMLLDYLDSIAAVHGFDWDVVLVHVGFHDIRRDPNAQQPQIRLENYRANVEAIVQWFLERKIQLIWIPIGPLDEDVHNARSRGFQRFEADVAAYNEAAEAILRRYDVPILDLPGFTQRLGPMAELLKDHVHFTDDVVKLQAAFVVGYLHAFVAGAAP